MSSTNHTTNYALPQWEATDAFKREDFNEAFSKIDTQIKTAADAAAGGAKIAVGSYTGTGEYGEEHPNSISFPFTPKIIMLVGDDFSGCASYDGYKRLIWEQLSESYSSGSKYVWLSNSNASSSTHGKKSGNTFYWYADEGTNALSYQFNVSGRTYYWIAIG